MKCGVVGGIKRGWQWLGDNPNTQRVLVMVTGAILISGLLQWYVMRQALHVTERPYVLFEGATMTPNISVGAKPIFQADFKNEGRTPAFIMDEQTTFAVYDQGLPINPQYERLPAEQPQNSALPPSGALNSRAIWPDKLPLTQELVNDLKSGKKARWNQVPHARQT